MIETGFDSINRKYREIWKKYLKEEEPDAIEAMHLNRWPLQYPPNKMKKKAILFVGFNPAYNSRKPFLKIDQKDYKNPESVLDNDKILNEALDIERKALSPSRNFQKKGGYYSLFPKIAEDVLGDSAKWSHLDLLPLRESSQDKLKESLCLNNENLFLLSNKNCKNKNYKNDDYKEFIKKLLCVFCDAVYLLDPLIIVVVNGYVSKSIISITGSEYRSIGIQGNQSDLQEICFKVKIDSENFKQTGARTMTIREKKYPLLLTSMITGKHALDLGSRERLAWHLQLIKPSLVNNV
ncbi:MAG: hypothetical protein QXP36_14835 [Conexivisphaerales archaeon]